LAKNEPLMAQEKIINDDGTPSDYLIRWLRSAFNAGEKTVKFPVTSVNGMTGDVVISIDDLFPNFEIDYDYINKKIEDRSRDYPALISKTMYPLMETDSHVVVDSEIGVIVPDVVEEEPQPPVDQEPV